MTNSQSTHVDLQAMAAQVMLAHGFEPEFPPAVQQQLADINARPPLAQASSGSEAARDLRSLLWSSIDNDTSRDLDQIEVAERLTGGGFKVMVGIADVDAFVAKAEAAGAKLGPRDDYGFMYQRQFDDPDGNHFAPFWMDPEGPPSA